MASRRAERVTLRDPAAIKALAHPARLAVLDQLMPDNELAATEIAAPRGVNPSCRGDPPPPGGSGEHERRWRMNPGGFAIDPAHPRAAAAAEATLIAGILDRQRRDVLAWFNSAEAEDPRRNSLATISTSYLWLTEAEMAALNQTVEGAVDEFADRTDADRPADALRVQVGFINVPAAARSSRAR